MNIYYIENDYGCGLSAAKDLESARHAALRENGTNHFRLVRKATKDDIAWVRAMGGYVPEIKKPLEQNEQAVKVPLVD